MGNLNVLLFTVKAGYEIDENTSKKAAKYGALDVLKWLKKENKFNAGVNICEGAAAGTKDLLDEKKTNKSSQMAQNGRLYIGLQYLHGCRKKWQF